MAGIAPKIGNKVRFTYQGKTWEGTITTFMYKSQQAVIDTKDGTKTVSIGAILRILS